MRNVNVCAVTVLFGPSALGVPGGTSTVIVESAGNFWVAWKAIQRPSCSFALLASTVAASYLCLPIATASISWIG